MTEVDGRAAVGEGEKCSHVVSEVLGLSRLHNDEDENYNDKATTTSMMATIINDNVN